MISLSHESEPKILVHIRPDTLNDQQIDQLANWHGYCLIKGA